MASGRAQAPNTPAEAAPASEPGAGDAGSGGTRAGEPPPTEVAPESSTAPSPTPADAGPALTPPGSPPPTPPPPGPVPPRAIATVEAAYPQAALDQGQQGRVELLVTVRSDGSVGEVDVALSAGPALDAAAIEAVTQWRFAPARRDGLPIDSRIRVPFLFAPPAASMAAGPTPAVGEGTATSEGPDLGTGGADAPIDVTVQGQRELRAEQRGASDFAIERDVLAAAPRSEGAEVLRSAPGVYIGRGEGPAVAHNYMLRGFDAEHGQDIAFRVGGLPINLPSHLHGQGYADLGFLLSDVVLGLDVKEGVYDPRQGDFAVAGSIDVRLGVAPRDRGLRLRTSYGAFGTSEQQVLWAPTAAPEESFAAVRFLDTDGFGENRAGQMGTGLMQHRFGEGEMTYRLIGLLHTVRSDLAGVLRRDDVAAGRVCFTCVYPVPTARAQNALASRVMVGLFGDYAAATGENAQLGVWLGYDNFRSQSNFTGFIEQSQVLERVGGRGDLIEQRNRTFSLGLQGRYRTAPLRPAAWTHGTLEVGLDGRLDAVEQSQNLLDAAVRNQTWDRRVDTSLVGVDLGAWADLDWVLTEYVEVRLGVRADLLTYEVDDRLGNFVPLTRPQDSFVPGFRRSAAGLAVGPRTSLALRPLPWLTLLAAYGEGYRSPQARTLEDGERAPFSTVRSVDAGVRLDLHDELSVSLGGYYTRLSDDVAFDAGEGRLERIGATSRVGAVAHVVARPLPWLVASSSATFVDATLLEPPPATPEEPQPPFEEGQNLPFVPPLVLRADVGAQGDLGVSVAGLPVAGRLGLGLSFLSARPLPFGEFADPFTLVDSSATLTWGPLALSLSIFNALDARYAAVEYEFASDWTPGDGVRTRTPARHTSAGSPRGWQVSLEVSL